MRQGVSPDAKPLARVAAAMLFTFTFPDLAVSVHSTQQNSGSLLAIIDTTATNKSRTSTLFSTFSDQQIILHVTHDLKMKTDNYLNLCLDQAAKSPLRYRHGAIIVRGGRVIGQGYNDYRIGFDGGALKTGLLPLRSLDGPAMKELKDKHKNRRFNPNQAEESTRSFTPFEHTTGGGKLANTPLSMHSEMMAIQSALSVAGSAASGTVSFQKSCCKLQSYSIVICGKH
jgi:deoxycytidylate deaminase